MNTIKECFEIILQDNRDESRRAARRVKKLLYMSKTRNKYNDIKNVINNAPAAYDKIFEDWRQENFVVAISVIYFLHDKEAKPNFFFPWLFQLLLHSSGVIRYAAVRMFSHELGPLTVYIRVPGFKSKGLTNLKKKQADAILFSLFVSLNKLLVDCWQPAYKKYKYISSLPTGPYKSVQMVVARMEELCGPAYFNNLVEQHRQYGEE